MPTEQDIRSSRADSSNASKLAERVIWTSEIAQQRARSLLPQSDELSASSQVVCGGAAQLSRSAVATGGVRDGYRYEKSGELFGLMRVRSLQMNDAHLYMTPEQFEAEFNAVNEMYLNYFKLFGIDKYLMRFSTHDPAEARPEICR